MKQHITQEQAKELPVLPEPKHAKEWQHDMYTADQLQAYGAACAAHAREVALGEAKQVMEKQHTWITNVAAAQLIEALKKAGK